MRELENLVHREFLLCDGDLLHPGRSGVDPEPVPTATVTATTEDAGGGDFRSAKADAIARFEHSYLRDLMRKSRGNVSLAARIAGKERRTLGKLLKKHRIDRREFA